VALEKTWLDEDITFRQQGEGLISWMKSNELDLLLHAQLSRQRLEFGLVRAGAKNLDLDVAVKVLRCADQGGVVFLWHQTTSGDYNLASRRLLGSL